MTRGAEFQALFQQGKRIDRPSLTVLWRATEPPRRAGFAVSRQIRSAVRRNRARRRLREAFRAARQAAPSAVALVILAKPPALEVPLGAVTAELREALEEIPGRRDSA